VYVGTTPAFHVIASNSGMLSSSACCRAFDAAADGFVPGEAVAAVVLKPLAAAERDRDHIYAVVRGSATNQDGRTFGITAPSARAQSDVECAAYEQAGIDPATLGYVEAHGTGTRLGDPIEVDALTSAFGRFTAKRQFCAIGSVKTNIGHAATAAGIAGFVKAALAVEHGEVPPTLHFERANEHIAFESTPFYVQTTLDRGARRSARSGSAAPTRTWCSRSIERRRHVRLRRMVRS
jgi:acyl transferase domain-containing protein